MDGNLAISEESLKLQLAHPSKCGGLSKGKLILLEEQERNTPMNLVTHNESLALNPPIQRPSGFGIKPPTNNLHWGNPNHGFIHRIICTKQGVSSCRDGVRSSPD